MIQIIGACGREIAIIEFAGPARLGGSGRSRKCHNEGRSMDDVPTVAAWPENYKTLRIDDCPFCGATHWHSVGNSMYGDVRAANCAQRDLPKRLRGKTLFYRLHRMHLRSAGRCEVIPFARRETKP